MPRKSTARPDRTSPLRTAARVVLALALVAGLVACDSGPPRSNRARAEARPFVARDLPNVLRGTIGAQASLVGDEPILVSGYGLVVDLDGTGSSDVPVAVRVEMEQMMTRRGVGGAGVKAGEFRGISPSELLNSQRTAVVLIRAAIPPGAPPGTTFDVRLDALPGTSTTSLEGGQLYTSELYRGQIRPGNPATQPIAIARGPVFINPFKESGEQSGNLRAGRILNGGVVTNPMSLMLVLDNPSHARARAIVDAINTAFPREPGAPHTAIGLSEEQIELSVPPSYRQRTPEFIELLRHTRVDQGFPEEWAVRYARALVEQPAIAQSMSWCLKAIGEPALPQIRPLYDHPEISPRLAALEAGAYLGDPTTRPYLEELALEGSPAIRPEVIRLLGRLGPDPRVNKFLRRQLDSDQIDIQVAAYEALLERADPVVRRSVVDDKFILDQVPSKNPMVYITQSAEPRVVLFGDELRIEVPAFASIWDDRLMIDARSGDRRVRVFYRDRTTGDVTQEPVRPELAELVEFLAHESTPEEPAPGLNLTYSETVGALSELVETDVIDARFVPETDRLALEVLRSMRQHVVPPRPEAYAEDDPAQPLWDDLPEQISAEQRAAEETTNTLKERQRERQFVVPVQRIERPRQDGNGG